MPSGSKTGRGEPALEAVTRRRRRSTTRCSEGCWQKTGDACGTAGGGGHPVGGEKSQRQCLQADQDARSVVARDRGAGPRQRSGCVNGSGYSPGERRTVCGYRRLHELLRREGWCMNHKRREQLYRGWGPAQRPAKARPRWPQQRRRLVPDTAANQRWSLDFTEDCLTNSRQSTQPT